VTEVLETSQLAPPPAKRARTGLPRIPATIVTLGIVFLLSDVGGDAASPLLPAFVGMVGGGPEALRIIKGMADAMPSSLHIGSARRPNQSLKGSPAK
jgi:hypothetical protein